MTLEEAKQQRLELMKEAAYAKKTGNAAIFNRPFYLVDE